MKFISIILFFAAFLVNTGFSQVKPTHYSLNGLTLSKSSSETPISNSINDIITVGDTLWLATSRGVSLSTDRGSSWTNFFNDAIFGQENCAGIAYKGGIVCATTAHSTTVNDQDLPEGSGIKITKDGGKTWYSFRQSTDDPGDSVIIYGINRMRALPITTAINNISYDVAMTTGYVWTANFAGGLRRANIDSLIANPNYKWQRIILPPDSKADSLITIRPDEIQNFSLQPVAGKFGPEDYLNHRVFSVIAVNDSVLYVGTAGGINITTDGGSSWTKVNHTNQSKSISGNFVVALDYNPQTESIWAGTWRAENNNEFNGVSFSIDNGNSWQTALYEEKVHNFGSKGNDEMAASDNGVFRTLNMGATWILPGDITDSDTKISLKTNTFYSAGSQGNDVWLGSDEGLVKLTETSGMWEGKWKIFLASQALASTDETYAYPNPFSPDVEQVKIKYSTQGKRQNVTIRIFDFGMNLIRTVVQNAERGNPIHTIEGNNLETNGVIDFWNGRDESGNIVPNGVYFYRVDRESGDPVFGKIMVIM